MRKVFENIFRLNVFRVFGLVREPQAGEIELSVNCLSFSTHLQELRRQVAIKLRNVFGVKCFSEVDLRRWMDVSILFDVIRASPNQI